MEKIIVTGGILGGMKAIEILERAEILPLAYTNFEFLDALYLDVEIFKQYIKTKESQPQ